jgi:hypothetical protein
MQTEVGRFGGCYSSRCGGVWFSGCNEQGNGCSFVGNKDDANGAIERTHLSIYPLSRPGLFRGAATGLFGSDLTQSVTSMVFVNLDFFYRLADPVGVHCFWDHIVRVFLLRCHCVKKISVISKWISGCDIMHIPS